MKSGETQGKPEISMVPESKKVPLQRVTEANERAPKEQSQNNLHNKINSSDAGLQPIG